MVASNPRIDALDREQRQQLEGWLIDFDRRWCSELLRVRVEALPATAPWRLAALVEMVKIDLERRWQHGERVGLADYLRDYPELGTLQTASADLVQAEYDVRRQFEETVDAAEFLGPYGARIEELTSLLAGSPLPTLVSRAPPVEALPRPFGPYRLVAELGRGGMGTVYLADDPRLGRQVALKMPHFDAARSAEAVARFRREARAAARARHPNLVPIYEVGEVDGIDYLTMPYITGEPLSARLAREGPLPEGEAVRLATRIADAMATVHRAGVVHRDLKPANVLLDEHGEPAVTDFGLARPIGPTDARMTASGTVLGTPAYLAPEQVGCRPEDMGPRCDVYSLGVILYEMLTGQLPFQGTAGQVLRKALTEEPLPPSRLRPDLDPRLEAVCLTAMAKDPAERFESMEEFIRDLESCLGEGAAPVHWRGRRRWVLAAAVVACLLGLGLWLGRPGGDGERVSDDGAAIPADDQFQVGSDWKGTYKFDESNKGTMHVIVTQRKEEDFRGTYVTNPGNYGWHIAGTVRNGQVRWGFTSAIAGTAGFEKLVGKGSVDAVLDKGVLKGEFRAALDRTMATFELKATK
jgi:hypothetical protein